MKNTDILKAAYPDIITKRELDHLKQERPQPSPQYTFTPHSAGMDELSRMAAKEREDRITKIRNHLEQAERKFRANYAYSSLKGRSKTDFDRSR